MNVRETEKNNLEAVRKSMASEVCLHPHRLVLRFKKDIVSLKVTVKCQAITIGCRNPAEFSISMRNPILQVKDKLSELLEPFGGILRIGLAADECSAFSFHNS